jgi:predicted dehydrogenase
MTPGTLRIGLIGAGRIARERHIPGFRALPDVTLAAVCNRHRASAVKVAREHGIPRVFGSWESLLDSDEIDAVVIGTWPYMHCPITLAALDAGKHVLTQRPMAMNAREAFRMLEKAAERPDRVVMVAPSPIGLAGDVEVRRLLADGVLGTLREVHVTAFESRLASADVPLSWRQVARYSGFNMLNLGEVFEASARWTPPLRTVFATARKQVMARPLAESDRKAKVGTPDSIQALVTYDGGATGTFRLSGLARFGEESHITLFGSDATIRYDLLRDEILVGRAGDPGLAPWPIPEPRRGTWNAEAEFVAAIRDERPVRRVSFAEGARTMQFTEAVARSSRHQAVVTLPLSEFSNPSL